MPCAQTTVPPPTLSGRDDELVDVQGFGANGGANDVDDGIDGADFVKVDGLDGYVVDLGFCGAEGLEDLAGASVSRVSLIGSGGDDLA